MAELLLFQLYGPMASWGEPAVGEYRPSATHPGKSQIIGLLAAALGIRRNQTQQLQQLTEGYGLAVRIDRHGSLLRDYHTTQVPSGKNLHFATRAHELQVRPLNTILSQRDYRGDGAWTCAIWAHDTPPFALQILRDALVKPRFTLYLGRKSCPPAIPLAPRILQTDTLLNAFRQYPASSLLSASGEAETAQRHYYWETPLPQGLEPGFTQDQLRWSTPRWDVPGDRCRWQFSAREEHHAVA